MTGCRMQPFAMQVGAGGGGDLGDANVWVGADIDAAIANAGGNLSTGDYLRVGAELFYAHVGGANIGTHAIPMCLPTSPAASPDTAGALDRIPSVLTAFDGVDPDAAGIPDWTLTVTNNGALTVADGVLTLSAPDASDRAYLGWSPTAAPDNAFVVVIYDIEGVCTNVIAAQGPNWQVRTGASDRSVAFRPDATAPTDPASPWEIDTAGTDPNITGSAVGTAIARMEVYVDPTTAPAAIRVRIGGPGQPWQAADETMVTFASAIAVFLDSGRLSAGQSLSLSGMVIAQVAS